MTKQEIIQEAYGEHWESLKDYIDENGWIPFTILCKRNINITTIREQRFHIIDISNSKIICAKPAIIQNIESNYGWIKIESEADLPKWHNEFYWTIDEFHQIGIRVFDQEEGTFFIEGECGCCDNGCNGENIITHYKIIQTPSPPIY